MDQESKIERLGDQAKVIKHLQRADWLFIILPMILSGVLLIIVPLVWSAIERASGKPTEIGGFNFDGLIIIAGIIFCSIFCVCYGVLAFILSLLTRRNITFRILLVGIPLLIVFVFYLYLVRQDPANFS